MSAAFRQPTPASLHEHSDFGGIKVASFSISQHSKVRSKASYELAELRLDLSRRFLVEPWSCLVKDSAASVVTDPSLNWTISVHETFRTQFLGR